MASPAKGCQRSSMDESLTNITWLGAVNLPGSLEETTGSSHASPCKESQCDTEDCCSTTSAASCHSDTTTPPSQAHAHEQQVQPKYESMDSQEFSVSAGDRDVDAAAGDRPPYSYASLIAMAIQASPNKAVSLAELYEWFENNYPYYKYAKKGWKNSIRHNLALRVCFQRVPMVNGRGSRWVLKKCRKTDELLAVKYTASDQCLLTDVQLDQNSRTSNGAPHSRIQLSGDKLCNSTGLSASHTNVGEPPYKRVFSGEQLYAGKENFFSERNPEEEVFIGPLPQNVLMSVCRHLGMSQHLYVLPQRVIHRQLRDCGVPLSHVLGSSQLTPTTTPTVESEAASGAHVTFLPIQHCLPHARAKMSGRVTADWQTTRTLASHPQHLNSMNSMRSCAAHPMADKGSVSRSSSTSSIHPLSAKSSETSTNIELPSTPRSTSATQLSPSSLPGANQMSTNTMFPADCSGAVTTSTPLRDASITTTGTPLIHARDRGSDSPWLVPTPPAYFDSATGLMGGWSSTEMPGYPAYPSPTLATNQNDSDRDGLGDMQGYIFPLADPASHITLSTDGKLGDGHDAIPATPRSSANSMPMGVHTPSRCTGRMETRLNSLTPGFTNSGNIENLLGLSPTLFKPSYEQFPVSPLNLTSFAQSPQFMRGILMPPAQYQARRIPHDSARPVLGESNAAAEPTLSR